MNIDSMDAKPSEQLPIVIEGHTFKPNPEGLWSLTEINKALPELTKPPAQWRGRERDYFERCANLHSVNGDQGGTWATERAAIAYAMACSLDFYVTVVDAFVSLRNDSILRERIALLAVAEADTKLAKVIPKADLIDTRLMGSGITWSQACKLAGIPKPVLAKQYLVYIHRFVAKGHPIDARKILKPAPRGFADGYFKPCSMSFGNGDGFRVTAKGLTWLQRKAPEINLAIAQRARRQAGRQEGRTVGQSKTCIPLRFELIQHSREGLAAR